MKAASSNRFTSIARSLRHRNYRLFFFGQGTSQVGTWLTRVATSWLVYRLTHSAWMLGVVSFAGLIPTFIFAPFAGVLADRWNKHRALVITQICAAVQSALLAILTLSGKITITEIMILSVFQGFINAFDFPIRQSMVVQMLDDKNDLPNAIALNSSMVNFARLIGPSFAGILIALVGEGGCFAIDAVSYLAVIATLLMMKIPDRRVKTTVAQNMFKELNDGFQYAKRSRAIVSVLILLGLVSFMGMPYMTLLPMIVTKQLSGDARILGYLTAASGLGALMGALFLASRKSATGLGKVLFIGTLTFGVGLFLFGVSHRFWISLGMIFFAGLGMMIQTAASNTILQTIVEESKRGRVLSLFIMAYSGMMPFGALLGGFMADRVGAALTLECGGAACLVGGILFLIALPEVKQALAFAELSKG